MSLALFGLSLPNLSGQSSCSPPTAFRRSSAWRSGSAAARRPAEAPPRCSCSVVYLLRRRGDWLENAGWATVALLASLAWLMPWYVIWLLPLAAFGMSLRLRRVAIAFTVFLIVTFIPVTNMVMGQFHINAMGTSVGQASLTLQKKLSQ